MRREHPRLVRNTAVATAAVALLLLVASVWTLVALTRTLPDAEAIQQIGNMQQSTAVFDADDALAFTIYEEQRIGVPLDRISPNLQHAIVAIEDQRFYEHHGFDLVRIVSAAMTNLRHGRAVQGGSTITQQLARQSFLSPEKTFTRKIQELLVAAHLERQFSKRRILELYLNKVYFGDGLYGAEAASRGYFGKHASDLSVPEAALLAGLVKSPSAYAPTVNRTRAIARRNVVLQAMLESGAIDRATWEQARASKPTLHDTLRGQEPYGQYFKEEVRKELVDRFGWQRVYEGGLRVYSTIDMATQIAAEKAAADQIKTIEERRKKYKKLTDDEPLQAALVAMDPVTGHVRAMVGGRDFSQSRFNRAVQAKRQPGSAFKPFVYATALEAGYTPATVIDHLDEPIPTLQGAWTPEDEHSDGDSMTMRTALRTSSNRAAVRMLQQVGIGRTVSYAKQMGVGDVPSVPSLALGSGEVTVESMTAAYAAFANHGLVPTPVLIRRVEDGAGTVLFENHDESHRAISDVTAFLMSSMLADVINAGTGSTARRAGFTLPAAGKTGTTNDFNDAWFVGYTPHDPAPRLRRRSRRADVGEVHESGDQGRQARLAAAAARRDERVRVPHFRKTRDRRVPGRRGDRRERSRRAPVHGLHRVLRRRHRADDVLRPAPDAQHPVSNRHRDWRPGEAGAGARGRTPAPTHGDGGDQRHRGHAPARAAREEETRLLVEAVRDRQGRQGPEVEGREKAARVIASLSRLAARPPRSSRGVSVERSPSRLRHGFPRRSGTPPDRRSAVAVDRPRLAAAQPGVCRRRHA